MLNLMMPNLTQFAVNIPSFLSDSLLSNMEDNNFVGEVNVNSVGFIQRMIRNNRRRRTG